MTVGYVALLTSRDWEVRSQAAGLLARIAAGTTPADEAVAVLIAGLKMKSPDWKVRRRAATLLGSATPGTAAADTAIRALIEALNSPDNSAPGDNEAASFLVLVAQTLARFGPEASAALTHLRALKNHPAPSVREAAQDAADATFPDGAGGGSSPRHGYRHPSRTYYPVE